MIGFMRLLVCGGLFAAGYYLGRQSYRLEVERGQSDLSEQTEAATEPGAVPPDEEG